MMTETEPKHSNEREGDARCAHDRVYSGEAFMTYSPKYAWICSICGRKGLTQFPDRQLDRPAQRDRFDALLQRYGW